MVPPFRCHACEPQTVHPSLTPAPAVPGSAVAQLAAAPAVALARAWAGWARVQNRVGVFGRPSAAADTEIAPAGGEGGGARVGAVERR